MKPLGVHIFRNGTRAIKISAASPNLERTIIEARLAALCEERERAARERMREDETWYALRKLYPHPSTIEGVSKQ